MIDGPDSITSAWQTAKSAAEDYASVVDALNGVKSEINTQTDSISVQSQIDSVLSQMQGNSAKWTNASAAERKRLEAAQEPLAAQLSALLGRPVVKDYQAGVWYLDRIGGTRLYHDGLEQGYVGADSPGQDEVLAVLKRGELVMTKDQYMQIFNSLKSGVFGVLDSLLRGLSSTAPIAPGIVEAVSQNNSSGDSDNGVSLQNIFYVESNLSEDNMARFADMYSTMTLEKMNSATRRLGGKNSLASSMLRG